MIPGGYVVSFACRGGWGPGIGTHTLRPPSRMCPGSVASSGQVCDTLLPQAASPGLTHRWEAVSLLIKRTSVACWDDSACQKSEAAKPLIQTLVVSLKQARYRKPVPLGETPGRYCLKPTGAYPPLQS